MSLLTNVKKAIHPISIMTADGNIVQSTHTARLNIPQLSTIACEAHIVPEFSCSLISTGVLTDAGYIVKHDSKHVYVSNKQGDTLLQGDRDNNTGLWYFNISTKQDDITNTPTYKATPAAIYPTNILKTKKHIAQWYHECFSATPIPTFLDAVANNRISLPNLTAAMVRQLRPTIATFKGHLDQKRQGLDSTKIDTDIESPTISTSPQSSSNIYMDYIKIDDATLHVDLSGKLPITSRSGYNYVLIMYNVDTNYIKAIPQKSRDAAEYIRVYNNALDFWKSHSITPQFVRIDNETSQDLEKYLRAQETPITIEKCPPGMHRTSGAERHMRTWKNHFLSTLITCDDDFPLDLWDELLPQMEITLNCLRESPLSPTISAWEHVHQQKYNFSSHPLVPPGMKICIFDNPTERASFAPHCHTGFYLGPALDHYRCYRVYTITTRARRITDTIGFLPDDEFFQPCTALNDAVQTAIDILGKFTPMAEAIHSPEIATSIDTIMENLQNIKATLNIDDLIAPPGFDPLLPIIEGAEVVPIREGVEQAQQIIQPQPFPMLPLQPQATGPNSLLMPPVRTRQQHRRSNEVAASTTVISTSRLTEIATLMTKHIHDEQQRQHYAHSTVFADAHAMDENNKPLTHRSAIRGPEADLWHIQESKELRKLLSPLKSQQTGTVKFIKWSQKPINKKALYYNPQVKVKIKENIVDRRVRGTIGGNISDYSGPRESWTAELETVKLLLNAGVSESAQFAIFDIKDFYLGTPLNEPEFMFITKAQMPKDIQEEFKSSIDWNSAGQALLQCDYALYGLPHAGRLSASKVNTLLAKHGYLQCPNTQNLFKCISHLSWTTFS